MLGRQRSTAVVTATTDVVFLSLFLILFFAWVCLHAGNGESDGVRIVQLSCCHLPLLTRYLISLFRHLSFYVCLAPIDICILAAAWLGFVGILRIFAGLLVYSFVAVLRRWLSGSFVVAWVLARNGLISCASM